MKWRRISGAFLRYFYIFAKIETLSDLIFWPALEIVLWGVTSVWIQRHEKEIPSIAIAILTGLVFWQIADRIAAGKGGGFQSSGLGRARTIRAPYERPGEPGPTDDPATCGTTPPPPCGPPAESRGRRDTRRNSPGPRPRAPGTPAGRPRNSPPPSAAARRRPEEDPASGV